MADQPLNVTLRIDRIISDQPGLDGPALQAALHAEITRVLAERGAAAFGNNTDRTQMQTPLSEGNGAPHARIAAATIKAVTS